MFRHLNLGNAWPDFKLHRLRSQDGTLRLATRPGSIKMFGPTRPGIPLDCAGMSGPASVSVDSAGSVYLPDPEGHQVLRWRACDETIAPVGCFSVEGSLPGQLNQPRGILVGPRAALYVADTGNHRVQIFDLETFQLRGVWGQDQSGNPVPSHEVGRFHEPSDLTADAEGFIYVVELGNRRIQKFAFDGRVIDAFSEKLKHQEVVLKEPVRISTIVLDGEERLLVLDRSPSRSLVYRTDGSFDTTNTQRWEAATKDLPGGLVFLSSEACQGYVKKALVFDKEGKFLGAVEGPPVTNACLTLDHLGRFAVQPSQRVVASLALGEMYVETGDFLAGPFFAGAQRTRWQRIEATVASLPSNAHIQFFTFTTDDQSVPEWPPSDTITGATAAGLREWRAAPMDALDFLILHQPAPFLWVGAVLQGDGHSSPGISQIRVEYEQDGWLRYLPEMYARADVQGAFLERSLAAFESVTGSVQGEINDLPRKFDPWAAPDQPQPSWLNWLSSWLAFYLDETWRPMARRQALAGAFDLLGRRGTVEGLKRFISLYAGVDVAIEEPAGYGSIWSLKKEANPTSTATLERPVHDLAPGSLGFTTMLAAAQPGGAVLDTTAVVDGSHVIDSAEYGSPLYEDLAHRFCVRVRASDLRASGGLEALREVIDREKPAHTTYQIRVVEPLMRVGVQARLGVDAIVGGASPDLVLDKGLRLGRDSSLPAIEALSRTIGNDSRVGVGTSLV